MRNTCIFIALAVWFALVVILSLARQWAAVVPLLALGGLFETLSHNSRS